VRVFDAGVFVIGMHRSGTSATARLVNLLGVSIGDHADLKPPSPANPTGYWEAESLTAFNDRLLRHLGGSWAAPPPLTPRWESDPRLARHRQWARRTFYSVYRSRQCVWKDPRTSVTLPFWLEALGVRPVVVLTHRQPLEVARSLPRRYNVGKRLALAIWERYAREALAAVRGLPVMVLPYGELVLDPVGWRERLRTFLERHTISCAGAAGRSRAAAFIDPGLRRHAVSADAMVVDPDVTPEQRELFYLLESRVGGHDSFEDVVLPPEPDPVEGLLAARRRSDLARWSNTVLKGEIDRRLASTGAVPVPIGSSP
jgi:hypothetical protein